jgi:hypothetical protein
VPSTFSAQLGICLCNGRPSGSHTEGCTSVCATGCTALRVGVSAQHWEIWNLTHHQCPTLLIPSVGQSLNLVARCLERNNGRPSGSHTEGCTSVCATGCTALRVGVSAQHRLRLLRGKFGTSPITNVRPCSSQVLGSLSTWLPDASRISHAEYVLTVLASLCNGRPSGSHTEGCTSVCATADLAHPKCWAVSQPGCQMPREK